MTINGGNGPLGTITADQLRKFPQIKFLSNEFGLPLQFSWRFLNHLKSHFVEIFNPGLNAATQWYTA